MRDSLPLGPTPAEESCAQVGEADYADRAKAECRRFIEQLHRIFPESEAMGCSFRIKPNEHDFGVYYEVVVAFDDARPESVDYAYFVENHTPGRWSDEAVMKFEVEHESV